MIRPWQRCRDYDITDSFFNFNDRGQVNEKWSSAMIQEPVNSNTLSHTVSTLVRVNGIRNKTKTYSTATDTVNRSLPKCLCLLRTLFNNSVLVTALTIGLIFGSIQGKNLVKCTGFYASYDESILCSTPLSKIDCAVHAWTGWAMDGPKKWWFQCIPIILISFHPWAAQIQFFGINNKFLNRLIPSPPPRWAVSKGQERKEFSVFLIKLFWAEGF